MYLKETTIMSTTDYIIRLSDDRTLSISPADADFYPLIRNMIDAIGMQSGEEIPLYYDDSEALYTIFTNKSYYIGISENPQLYMRLINAVDYLGREEMMDIMLKDVVHWLESTMLSEPARQRVIEELTGLPYQRLMMFIERRKKGWPMIPIHETRRRY